MPKNIEAASAWFYNNSDVENLDPCTGNIVPGENNCDGVIMKILRLDTMRQMNICTKIMWQYKYFRQLLDMKKKGLLSPECENWLRLQNLNAILQVVKISKAVDSLNIVKINTMNWVNNTLARDSISRSADSIRLIINRTVLVDSCLKVMNRVNDVRLNQIVNDSLSQTDISVLKPIAEACPTEKGEGVYWARGMMSMYIDTIYPGYEDCIISEINPRSEKLQTSKGDKMNIFPNPASGMVSIDIEMMPDEFGELLILDINSNVIFKSEADYNAKNIKIDTNTYIPGIYLVKYSSSIGEDKTVKLVILK